MPGRSKATSRTGADHCIQVPSALATRPEKCRCGGVTGTFLVFQIGDRVTKSECVTGEDIKNIHGNVSKTGQEIDKYSFGARGCHAGFKEDSNVVNKQFTVYSDL